MIKKIIFCISILIIIPTALLSQQGLKVIVHLKDGLIVSGTVIETIPNKSIKIQREDGTIFFFNKDDILKITKDPSQNIYKKNIKHRKSSGLAFTLSFLVPGVGQYYNGDIFKGIIQESLYATGLVLAFTLGWETKRDYWTNWDYSRNEYIYHYYYYDEETPWLYVGLGLTAGSFLWSVVDAPISAHIKNKRNARNYGHLMEFEKDKNVLGFDIKPIKKGIGVNLSYHF